jgi:predicted membrane protein
MEIIDPQQKREFEQRSNVQSTTEHPETRGRILAGLVIIIIGGLILAQKLGAWFPDWLFSWQMLLIAIGFFAGAKHNFRLGGWLVPIFIGILFLFDNFLPDLNLRPYFIPIILIIIGAVMMLAPGGRRMRRGWQAGPKFARANYETGDDTMESVSIFGGVKRNIISKSFMGGESVTIFGGSEINLMQADIQGKVSLEIVQVFGGTKLIIPANWQIQSELVSIFGDIQDARTTSKDAIESNKILVIKGVSILGGISVKSY